MKPLSYLQAYPDDLQRKVGLMLEQGGPAAWLRQKYPKAHGIRTDGALYQYVTSLKNEFLRSAEAVSKVAFDSKIHVIKNALGTHTTISRVQGAKLKTKREIRVAVVFKEMPPEFLRMIVVHELAHMKEREHDKAFYQLCMNMEPDYAQLEFHLRAYLTYLDAGEVPLWKT